MMRKCHFMEFTGEYIGRYGTIECYKERTLRPKLDAWIPMSFRLAIIVGILGRSVAIFLFPRM